MLAPRLLRTLSIDPRQHPRGQAHLSSASGLVLAQGLWFVVADDEQHLACFDARDEADFDAPLSLLRLFEGDLPQPKGERKDAKPDLETLAALLAMPGCPHGALLALGSGSRPARQRAVLLALDAPPADGASSPRALRTGRIAQIDLSALYAPLRERFKDLNIEGAFVASGELRLLQRGNKGGARNACISFDWNQIAPWLTGRRKTPPAAKAVQMIDLSRIDGVPLGLTDGAALAGGMWAFSAVAEDTDDSYADGACASSAIGIVGPDGALLALHSLLGAPKVEGIHLQPQGGGLLATMVTDPDDPALASQMLQAVLPWPVENAGAPNTLARDPTNVHR